MARAMDLSSRGAGALCGGRPRAKSRQGRLELMVCRDEVAATFQDLCVGRAIGCDPLAAARLVRLAERGSELGVDGHVVTLSMGDLRQPVVGVGNGRPLIQSLRQDQGLLRLLSRSAD